MEYLDRLWWPSRAISNTLLCTLLIILNIPEICTKVILEREVGSSGSRGVSMGSYKPPSDFRPVNNICTVANLLPEHRSASAPTAEFMCNSVFNL